MKKKKVGFWQWVKSFFKKHPLVSISTVSILFAITFEIFAITYEIFIEDGALILLAAKTLWAIPFILFIFWLFILTPYKFIKDKKPLTKKINIFNFIRWLIFVLLTIGLPLSGIGVYNLMQSSSRINATKTIYSQTVKYISAELQKCKLGYSKFMGNNQECPATTSKAIIGAVATMTDVNPYDSSKLSIRTSNSNTNDEDVGYISLSASGSDIIINSCNKTPCNKEANHHSSTVSIK